MLELPVPFEQLSVPRISSPDTTPSRIAESEHRKAEEPSLPGSAPDLIPVHQNRRYPGNADHPGAYSQNVEPKRAGFLLGVEDCLPAIVRGGQVACDSWCALQLPQNSSRE